MTEKKEKLDTHDIPTEPEKIEALINHLRQRIVDLSKNKLRCISCLKDIPADSIWCPYCKIQQGR